ncbi:preQ(1) synthase [Chitinispirillales bacterium ANBcel5]|uniref:preQ(1) synthase n=1 Tax=Cellulosispirillum alkaliphilum TaxID=3039283 RepID=UPI002A54BD05|nr:preQ(1) synthase [Chitinispirillales bacterium ANBcel5]
MFFKDVIQLEQALEKDLLPPIETFPCPYDSSATKSGVIRIVFPEFTCVCPKTGYPDFAAITLYYLPDKLCLELKAWKLYLNSFRMVGTFHETVTHHLFETLKTTLLPKWLLVTGDFLPRGNVDTTVVFETLGERPAGADLIIKPLSPHCREMN